MASIETEEVKDLDEFVRRLKDDPEDVYRKSRLHIGKDFEACSELIENAATGMGKAIILFFISLFYVFKGIWNSAATVILLPLWPIVKRKVFNEMRDEVLKDPDEFIKRANESKEKGTNSNFTIR